MSKEGDHNKKLMEVLKKDVAVVPCTDGWMFKFTADALSELLDKAVESGEDAAFVFVKTPPAN